MDRPISRRLIVQESQAGARLDVFLTQVDEIPSRSFAQNLIEVGLVTVDKVGVSKHHKVKSGEVVEYKLLPPESSHLIAQDIPLDIRFEDEYLLVVSKPSGMVVHPSFGHTRDTLVNALLAHAGSLANIGGVRRPGIVHRLDKDVSGLMVVAKDDESHISLSDQLSEHQIQRRYQALVHGLPATREGTIELPLGRSPRNRKKIAVVPGGRRAVTHFRVAESYSEHALLDIELETGRTHQIRVHLAHIGHPIVADPVYGRRHERLSFDLSRLFLHAVRLSFRHPKSGVEITVEDQLPEELHAVLETLRADSHDLPG